MKTLKNVVVRIHGNISEETLRCACLRYLQFAKIRKENK